MVLLGIKSFDLQEHLAEVTHFMQRVKTEFMNSLYSTKLKKQAVTQPLIGLKTIQHLDPGEHISEPDALRTKQVTSRAKKLYAN